MFKEVNKEVNFPELERKILEFWEESKAFAKLVEKNKGKPRWSFLDGPITANNPMGVHHAWGRTYKDLFQRFKAMQGHELRYQNGFDGQGLWIEVEVEKELGFKSKRDIENYGIAKFVEKCKERVRHFSNIITQQSIRLGYWMDWENSYHTMSDENNYTIWLFLKRCHEQGWIYKGHDVLPWCPRCSTALSEHEIATEGYRELVHPGLTVKFPLVGKDNEFLLVWTTTPWTLAANVAAAVHPDFLYVKVQQREEYYYLAKKALSTLIGDYKIIEELQGRKLAGWRYYSPFDELPAQAGVEHKVVLWKEVSEEEGTGIVHIAPGCGKEDFSLGKEHNLAAIAPLDEFGNFVEGFSWLSGKNVYEVAEPIFEDLKRKALLYRLERYKHRYPVCWRCESELVFRLVDEWFISMKELRHRIMEVAKKIRWIPSFGLDQELDWLRNMSDWMISKKRYWGLALPIWECQACGHFEVIGSEAELKEKAVEGWQEFAGHSPHRPWIDAVKIQCEKCKEKVPRIPDVGNPWLDAGIVPFSTLKYRHDRSYWQQWFPAEFITECFPGQFRNWFYSLLAMSTVLENKEPFRVVLGHALVLGEDGREMHKSWGNAIEFDEAAERMGADVMRWIFLRQNPERNLLFGYKLADEVKRRLLTLWNVYSFYVTYANIDKVNPTKDVVPESARPPLDRWILAELNLLIQKVSTSLEQYAPAEATRAFEAFLEKLSTWYVRRSRRRFWKSEFGEDKLAAHQTLYEALVTLAKLLAPFVPFLAEEIHQNLVRSLEVNAPESVHHCDWPAADPTLIDHKLIAETELVMKIVSLGRAARVKAGIRVRQPLEGALLKVSQKEKEALERLADQVLEELNVKELIFVENTQMLEGQAGYALAGEEDYLVGVTTEITTELKLEGMARELVRHIQEMRKEADLNVTDHIITYYQGSEQLKEAIAVWGDYIKKETLSKALIEGEVQGYSKTLKLNEEIIQLGISQEA